MGDCPRKKQLLRDPSELGADNPFLHKIGMRSKGSLTKRIPSQPLTSPAASPHDGGRLTPSPALAATFLTNSHWTRTAMAEWSIPPHSIRNTGTHWELTAAVVWVWLALSPAHLQAHDDPGTCDALTTNLWTMSECSCPDLPELSFNYHWVCPDVSRCLGAPSSGVEWALWS